MTSNATTVESYLAELPADRCAALNAVRDVIRKNLDPRIEEGMQYGMIGYYVPKLIYPSGYHCDPKQCLPYGGLASQKNYMSLYLMCYYSPEQQDWLVSEWAKTGKKLDMGKACIRFKKLEDMPLELIGEAIRRITLDRYLEAYQAAIPASKRKAK